LVWFYPLIAVLTTFACLAIHEFGHVLAAWLTGGHVAEIVLFSALPHVRILGTVNDAQEAFRAVGGSAATLTFCCLFALLTPRGTRWQFARDAATAFAGIELTGWMLSSLLYGRAANPDDAQYFLRVTGVNPLLVSAICLLIGAAGFVLLRARRRRQTPDRPAECRPEPALQVRAASAGR
jgi:hypothetical protein